MSDKTASEIFMAAFAEAKPIEFNPAWANGTGYFDSAVSSSVSPKVDAGEVLCCTDNQDRKILIIGCGVFGNFVIFSRYSAAASGVFVFNAPRQVESAWQIGCGAVSPETMLLVVGDGTFLNKNIGLRIKNLLADFQVAPKDASEE